MDAFDCIFMSIRQMTRAIDVHSRRLAKTTGLSVPQLLVLRSVRRQGGVPIRAIANDVCLSQATVTSIIDRLESQGYLNRERSREDRRVVHVNLTTAGEEKLDGMPELMQADFVRAFGKLDRWEQQMLMSSLERIARMLNGNEHAVAGGNHEGNPEDGRSPQVAA